MKTFIKNTICTLALALGMVACETTDNSSVPTIEVVAVDSTSKSITFVINTQSEECAYMLYDGENINADTIFSQGTKTKSGVITINDLEANTKYYVAAAARNGKLSAMETIMMQTKASTNNDDNGGNDDNNDDNNEVVL